MQFVDLGAQQKRIKKEIDARISSVLAHGNYIMGPEVKELEKKLAAYVGTKHAIGCASGTDALLLALMAYGVGPGDAVFTTPFTFISTAGVISLLGATPVFVDIDPATFNIDPSKLDLAIKAVRENNSNLYPLPRPGQSKVRDLGSPTSDLRPQMLPRGIITVDLFGLPADYDSISPIAAGHDLFLIEDAAQSFGAVYKGRKACSLGDIGCTSFFPAKPLGGYGDGGMCFTNDANLAGIMDSLRVHGKGSDKYDNVRVGINGRLDTLQAAILLAKFDIFPEEVMLRGRVAESYSSLLSARNTPLALPFVPEGSQSVWAQYSVLARTGEQRTATVEKLKKSGIPSAIYYPRPLHLQTAYSFLNYARGDFPVCENCAARIFSLPMHPYLPIEEQDRIAEIIQAAPEYP